MKIVSIFADKLFSIHYDNESQNELTRLIELWGNADEIHNFLASIVNDIGGIDKIEPLQDELLNNRKTLIEILYKIGTNKIDINLFFKQLNNNEYQLNVLLSKRKGRVNYLRIYALKIDENCFLVTGGAIKFTKLMQDRPHTLKELFKIEKCRTFLMQNDVTDVDSLYEFLNEDEQ